VLCGALAALAARSAFAQSCHAPPSASAASGPSVSLAVREATVDTDAVSADYQGVLLGLGYARAPLEAAVVLPAYRLDAGAGAEVGLSDLLLDVRAALIGAYHDHADHHDHLQAGLELAATLPTGDEDIGLGMGHVMLMPGLFVRVHDAHAALLLQAGYGRALTERGHAAGNGRDVHAHGALGSLVDPMSDSELEAGLTISVRASARYALLATLAAATPIATEGGRARASIGGGGSAALGPLSLALVLELPMAGDAFEQRVTLSATLAP
jgi:hypothetical protein